MNFVKPVVVSLSLILCSTAMASAKSVLNIQQWKTKNGANVLFVRAKEIPMVDVAVVFKAGSARDGKKAGLAEMTMSMIDQGTRDKSADQIAENFDKVGAEFGSNVARDMAVISLRSLTAEKYLHPALKQFSDLLTRSDFPAPAFYRTQKNTLAALLAQEQSPSAIAGKAFYKKLYKNHPYAHPVLGTRIAVEQLTPADLKSFYKQYFVGKNAIIAIVGDVSRKEAATIADETVGKLKAGQAAAALPPVTPLASPIVDAIKFPSSQTHVLIGQTGIKRGSPNFFPLTVGNFILGGNPLGSRLFNNVREKRGLSYSVYSYFIPMADNGPFVIGLQTKSSQTAEAVKVTENTLKKFISQGPSATELSAAIKSITGSFPLRIDSNAEIVSNLAMIGFYHLPLTYLDTYRDNIKAVTLTAVKKAFANVIHPAKMVRIDVGSNTLAKNKHVAKNN